MRVILLNTNSTTSRRLDEWLERAEWDVAVLLEVSRRVGERLAEDGVHWQASSSASRATAKPGYPVAILGRGVGALSEVPVPARLGTRERRYDERIHAVGFDWNGTACTVVGLHAPNAVKKSQADKEAVYKQFADWVRPLAAAGPVIAALDTNNGHWRHSPDHPERADMVHQSLFLSRPETAGLREAYCDVHDGADPKPATWGSHFYDRVFLSSHLRATGFSVDGETFRREDADGNVRLPDHAAVTLDLEFPASTTRPAVARNWRRQHPAIEILMVCTGNTCRSPMAAALLGRRLDEAGVKAVVSSAGLLFDGKPATEYSLAVMAGRGLDTSAHRSRKLRPDLVGGADIVIGMAREHIREAVVLAPDIWGQAFTLKEIVRRGEERGGRAAGEPLEQWLARLHQGRRRPDLLGGSDDDDVAQGAR